MFPVRRTAESGCVLGVAMTLWLSPVVAPIAVSGRVLQTGRPPQQAHERITIADNRVAAGTVADGTLTIRLEARTGEWYPDRDTDPGVVVKAFAVEGGPLQIPGPLIRVPEGTGFAPLSAMVLQIRCRCTGCTHVLAIRPAASTWP